MFTFCFGPFIIKVTMSALVVASAPGPAEAAAAASAAAGLSSVAHVRGVARALGYPSWEVLDFRGGRPSREASTASISGRRGAGSISRPWPAPN